MRNFLILSIVVFGPALRAQTFNVRHDVMGFHTPDVIWDVELESDGYFLLCGTSESLNSPLGLSTIKISFDGQIEDEIFIQNENYNIFGGSSNSAFPTIDGGYFLGSSSDSANTIAFGALFGADADTIWTIHVLDSMLLQGIGYSGIQCLDGGYLICGSASHEDMSVKAIVYKFNSNGELEWTQEYGENNVQLFVSVSRLSDGGYLLGGKSFVPGNSYDSWIVKINSVGDEIWSEIYQGISGEADGSAFLVNNIDDVFVFSTYLSSTVVASYPAIVKINPENGESIWYRTYGDDHYDTALTSIKAVNSGEGFIAAGTSNSDSEYRGILVRINEDGDSLWMRQYQWMDGNHSFFRDVIPAENGGFVAAGYVFPIDSLDLSQDAWIIKTDENGCLVPGCEVGIEEFNLDQRLIIYPNPAADIVNFHFQSKSFLNNTYLEILDITGKTVLHENFSAAEITLMMDASKLSSGLYFVRIVSEGEVLLTEKFEKW